MDTREHIVLSAIEKDRPGLVAELSGFVARRRCNVEDSRVIVLGGHAVIMFLISGDPAGIALVEHELDALERDTGLRAVVRRIEHAPEFSSALQPAPSYLITASAMDHEGIIHAIADVVRANGGNIVEMETTTESAPMSGSPLFALRMVITVAERYGSVAKLRGELENLARGEAIDVEWEERTNQPLIEMEG
jgi:glycine cleavage system transcriptional repressor